MINNAYEFISQFMGVDIIDIKIEVDKGEEFDIQVADLAEYESHSKELTLKERMHIAHMQGVLEKCAIICFGVENYTLVVQVSKGDN